RRSLVRFETKPAGGHRSPLFRIRVRAGTFCNALFPVGSTIAFRAYSPGLLTALGLYVPLSALLVVITIRPHILSVEIVAVAALIATAFHVFEVGHSVFKRWSSVRSPFQPGPPKPLPLPLAFSS